MSKCFPCIYVEPVVNMSDSDASSPQLKRKKKKSKIKPKIFAFT